MIGIRAIETFLPDKIVKNSDNLEKFNIDEKFLHNKIGVLEKRKISSEEDTSTIALEALKKLLTSNSLDGHELDILIVVTQNPDSNIPHVSGKLHYMANLRKDCATFDISLGCSGYVYGLSIIQSFMEKHGLSNGVLITADPYSKILNEDDKNTSLLFGDGASATLISNENVIYELGGFAFGSKGDNVGGLTSADGVLKMNGREVFNFVMQEVPQSIEKLLHDESIDFSEIDSYIFHQGSKAIIDSLARSLRIPNEKVENNLKLIGNTVSTTIPIILSNKIKNPVDKKILMSGFGVGFSHASCIIYKKNT